MTCPGPGRTEIKNAHAEDARRDYFKVHSTFEEDRSRHPIVWQRAEIIDEENRVVEINDTVGEGLSIYFHIEGLPGIHLTVWAETVIGKIPVHSSSLEDGFGPHMMGHRWIPAVANRYIITVEPIWAGSAPVLTLAIAPRTTR